MNGAPDPFHLERFVEAQADGVFEQALAELRAGQKHSHWMWPSRSASSPPDCSPKSSFPQHRDLGRSETAKHYGLSGVEEVRAYAAHPLLGPRLRECAAAVLEHLGGKSAEAILGPVDAMKLRSSMDIFGEAIRDELLFGEVRQMAD